VQERPDAKGADEERDRVLQDQLQRAPRLESVDLENLLRRALGERVELATRFDPERMPIEVELAELDEEYARGVGARVGA
jgi:hypothetical protein